MNDPTPRHLKAGPALPLPIGTLIGFWLAFLAIAGITYFSYRAQDARADAVEMVTHTFDVIDRLAALPTRISDTVAAGRGFLLTGEERSLVPYSTARALIPGEIDALRRVTADNPRQQSRIELTQRLTSELTEAIDRAVVARRNGDVAGALALAGTTDDLASRLRVVIAEMDNEERGLLAGRQATWDGAVVVSSWITWGGSVVLIVLVGIAAFLMSRDHRLRETEAWIRSGQAGLATRLQGEQRLETLGDSILTFLGAYLGAHVGAVYVAADNGALHRVAGLALPEAHGREVVLPGDGLLGRVAKEQRPQFLTDVPADYLPVTSAIGRTTPRALILTPAIADGVTFAVTELGFLHPVGAAERDLLDRVSEALAVAVRTSRARTRLEELLEQTQRQAEELQTQQEELRVSNEELEEQGRVLRESHVRLESQQAELEQTNSQLEDQAQLLEFQKDQLSKAQVVVSERAADLERANQYKSEFLANMSHELRTPLNSSLILSKLLADNRSGNLTDEQIKFAQTIHSAGNDLLALINDILDLSKIEAGKVELVVEPVQLARTIDGLVKEFEPVARERGLAFRAMLAPDVPAVIETDGQRLGQILKNLISNAVKFTESGEVTLRVAPASGETVSFEVRDTGIGIPDDQQVIIFEAFRQADGSTHRKYGGTGLGLSISRDLAGLLGGDIRVSSSAGHGSTFTLTLPVINVRPESRERAMADADALPGTSAPRLPHQAAGAPSRQATEDDRHHLTPASRLILVVEDDPTFAIILRDLAHERGFQCVMTHSAGDGLDAAAAYQPSAIVLDVNLPDHSGLGVLEQLKRSPQTRHIPVHIVSVADYTQQALERGAVGYALKPVKREQLIAAFRQLEAKATQTFGRVLVVEDDATQRESIRLLLEHGRVQITQASNSEEALAELQVSTFDCMVMDLNLPDMSGYELIERMAARDDVSFPPVIVYTGRVLTADEEQRLRRFSRSIIIKDARSPERLLDEVTLFLHQVESSLPVAQQKMLKVARDREEAFEGRRILVVEDDVRNIFALSSILEPKGAKVEIARNGREAIEAIEKAATRAGGAIDLVLMDIMMPEMDGLTAMREIRRRPEWRHLPIIALTAKAMRDDHETCLAAGASDYIAKPLDVEKLLSLVRVWMRKH